MVRQGPGSLCQDTEFLRAGDRASCASKQSSYGAFAIAVRIAAAGRSGREASRRRPAEAAAKVAAARARSPPSPPVALVISAAHGLAPLAMMPAAFAGVPPPPGPVCRLMRSWNATRPAVSMLAEPFRNPVIPSRSVRPDVPLLPAVVLVSCGVGARLPRRPFCAATPLRACDLCGLVQAGPAVHEGDRASCRPAGRPAAPHHPPPPPPPISSAPRASGAILSALSVSATPAPSSRRVPRPMNVHGRRIGFLAMAHSPSVLYARHVGREPGCLPGIMAGAAAPAMSPCASAACRDHGRAAPGHTGTPPGYKLPHKHAAPVSTEISLPVCRCCKRPIMPNDKCVNFYCPECGQTLIWRCQSCREAARTYRCDKCGFEGP